MSTASPAGRALMALSNAIDAELVTCEQRAFRCLASHDYTGFGSYASRWSMLARLAQRTTRSPFRDLVTLACAQAEINKRKGEKNV